MGFFSKLTSFFTGYKEIDEEFGVSNIERYPNEEELQSKYNEAGRAYLDYCRGIELERIKECLLKEGAKA